MDNQVQQMVRNRWTRLGVAITSLVCDLRHSKHHAVNHSNGQANPKMRINNDSL